MSKYIVFIGLILVSIAQVAWAPFILVRGVIVPITLIYLWLIGSRVEFGHIALLAFVAGIVIDLQNAQGLGVHAFSLLIVIGLIRLVESKTLHRKSISRIVSLGVGIIIYVALVQLIQNLI